jgi:hypothetical protein
MLYSFTTVLLQTGQAEYKAAEYATKGETISHHTRFSVPARQSFNEVFVSRFQATVCRIVMRPARG